MMLTVMWPIRPVVAFCCNDTLFHSMLGCYLYGFGAVFPGMRSIVGAVVLLSVSVIGRCIMYVLNLRSVVNILCLPMFQTAADHQPGNAAYDGARDGRLRIPAYGLTEYRTAAGPYQHAIHCSLACMGGTDTDSCDKNCREYHMCSFHFMPPELLVDLA